jgi:hypothetical protein
MNLIRRLSVSVMAFVIGCTLVPAAAQDEGASLIDDVGQLEGIQAGVNRTWSVDFSALPSETEQATMDAWVISGAILKFDTADNAGAAFQAFSRMDDAEWLGDLSAPGIFERESLNGLGDQAYATSGVSADDDDEGHFRVVVVQDGQYLYFANVLSMSKEGTASADALIDHFVNDGAEGAGDPVYNKDGGSSGGLWGYFPADDAAYLSSLAPAGDDIIFPEPAAQDA